MKISEVSGAEFGFTPPLVEQPPINTFLSNDLGAVETEESMSTTTKVVFGVTALLLLWAWLRKRS